jgi:hypothetical protein
MAISDLTFSSWPLSKQYLAAHYYLSEEKPISITEAQRAQLGSLHLFVSFGPYSETETISELNKCTLSEKRRRIEEWKSLGQISKSNAMKKFIDLLNNLFPNWTRYRKLHYEFEMEWINMQKIIGIGNSPLNINPKELTYEARKTVTRSLSPIQTSLRRPHKTVKDSVPKAIKAVTYFQKSRIMPFLPQIPKLNAVNDAKDTLYALKKDHKKEVVHNVNGESIYYRFPHSKHNGHKRTFNSNFFGSLVEELVKTPSKPQKTPARPEKEIEPFTELDFMKDIQRRISVWTM